MAKKKAVKKGQKKTRTMTEKGRAAQEALQTTWLLKGSLKNAQLSYLRVGKLLAQVREKKMYATLGHADIEDYAEKRLQLGRSSLYKYLQVYDWVSKNHLEWLQPKPKGFIPELADVAGLIEIESELNGKNVFPKRRKKLVELRDKALAGDLRDKELTAVKKSSAVKVETLKTIADGLKSLRRKAGKVVGMPEEFLAYIDAALALLNNEKAVAHLEFSRARDRMLA